ncbi:SGNH/GDSL hydrolase family protein [Sinomonas halotolerans]
MLLAAGLALLVLAAVAAGLFAAARPGGVGGWLGGGSPPGGTSSGAAGGASNEKAGTDAAPGGDGPLVAFIGDSYTAGSGPVPREGTWAARLARAEGWRSLNVAVGGTGYLKEYRADRSRPCAGQLCSTYLTQAAEVVRAHPDVVIVAGGRNDGPATTPQLDASVDALYAQLRDGLPEAQIIALSPILGADDSPRALAGLRTAVRNAVVREGGTYVDLGAPLAGRPDLILGDGVHPNAAGHELLADVTARLLPPLRRR